VIFLQKEGFMEKLKRKQGELTQAQKKLAEYVLQNLEEVAFMSASVLGRKAGVSESTVVRFSQLLGYKGFPELKEALREVVIERLDTSKRLSMYLEKGQEEHILFQSVKKDRAVLDLLLETVSIRDFDNVIETLENAKRIYIVSHRSAYAIGYYLAFYLHWLGFPAVLLKGKDFSYEVLTLGDKDDVVIGITFPRYSSETVELFSFAADRGMKTVAITDDYLSPIASKASYVLTVPTDFISFVDSLTGPMSLVNAVIVALSLRNLEAIKERLQGLEKVWEEKSVYWRESYKGGKANDK